MTDDERLKVVFWVILALAIVALLGAWEALVRPIFFWLISLISA